MDKILYDSIISSDTFSKLANVVYGQQIRSINLNDDKYFNYEVIYKNNKTSLIKIKSFRLKENDIIYCNTELINFLFEDLKQARNFKNIILITHDSDIPIDKRLFEKKPDCISQWFAINVNFRHNQLKPIPIGIGGDYLDGYVTKNILDINTKLKSKDEKLFLCFSDNTNYRKRSGLKKYFKNFLWSEVISGTLKTSDYIKKIKNNKFVLCPEGNGMDTYRIWETLVLGSIPVAQYTPAFYTFKKFPIIFYSQKEEVNLDMLNKQFKKNINADRDFLTIDYWRKEINNYKNHKLNYSLTIFSNEYLTKKLKEKYLKKRLLNSKTKILKYYTRKYLTPENYFKKLKSFK